MHYLSSSISVGLLSNGSIVSDENKVKIIFPIGTKGFDNGLLIKEIIYVHLITITCQEFYLSIFWININVGNN
jgi:hypothetical protein